MKRHAIENARFITAADGRRFGKTKALEITRRAIKEDKLYAQHWHNAVASSCWDAIEDAELKLNNYYEGIDKYAVANDAASRFMKLCLGINSGDVSMQATRD